MQDSASKAPARPRNRPAKSNARYWKEHVFRPTYSRGNKQYQLPEYSVRIHVGGRREVFALKTPVRDQAAARARDIYLRILSHGMDVATEEEKTHVIPKSAVLTFGDYFNALEHHAEIKPRTLADYKRKVHTLLAEVHKLKKPTGRMARCGKSRREWLAALDAIKLSEITHHDIVQWRKKRLSKADPKNRLSAARTANSHLRALKCCFAKKHLINLRHLDLPDELPGSTVPYLPEGSKRYRRRINPVELVKDAGKELAEQDPEAYKVFLLALIAGMRRSEIDLLLWEAVNLKEGCIRVEPNSLYELKSFSSEGTVYLQQEAVDFLKRRHENDPNPGPFVLKSEHLPRRHLVKYNYYRADETFKNLTKWLREKGITDQKPLHMLRKEFGSLIASNYDIFAASRALRHSSLQMTVSVYAEERSQPRTSLPISGKRMEKL